MLHVHLLALPDYLGYDDAIQLVRAGFKDAVERGLRLKRLGNDLMAAIGGREIHPVSPRVGGFSKAVAARTLRGFQPRLEDALVEILEVADLVAPLEMPEFPRPAEMVALTHPTEYAINEGSMASTEGRAWSVDAYEDVTREIQVAHSNALHSVFTDTETPYFLGPLARVVLNEQRLTPVAREAAARAGLGLPTIDPFASMAARVVEVALALEDSLRLIAAYEPPDPPSADGATASGSCHLGHGGAPGDAVSPVRRRERRDDPRSEDRAAHVAEPPAYGEGSRRVPPRGARSVRR